MNKIFAPILLAIAVLGLAGCNKSGNNQNSTDLRVVNAVADAEPLDLLVNDDVKVAALPLNGTSGFVNFSSGTQDTKVRSSTTQAILLDANLSYASGARNTLFLFGKRTAVGTLLLGEDTTTPASGKTRVRVIGLAPDAGAVDVYLTATDISAGSAVVSSAAPGALTPSAEVTAGSFKIIVTAAGTQDILFQSPSTYTFNAGSQVTVAIMPALGGKLVNVDVLEQGASGTSTFIANPVARIKAVNGIVDSSAVNFKVDGTTLLSSVPFTGTSSYVPVTGGSRNVAIEASNVPGTNIAAITTTFAGARDYTVLAYGRLASPTLSAILDDNVLPAANFSKVRFVNALSDGGTVDVLVNFASQASGIAPGKASSYFTIAAGLNYTISFTTPGGVTVVASLSGVELDSLNVYSVYVFGTAGAAQAKLVRDR